MTTEETTKETSVQPQPYNPDNIRLKLFRYWNDADHFYTTNPLEIGTDVVGIVGKGKYKCEGFEGYTVKVQ